MAAKYKPIEISTRGMENLISKWYHRNNPAKGAYYCHNGPKSYTAADNRTGDMWVEEFHTKRECLAWLKEDVEGLDE